MGPACIPCAQASEAAAKEAPGEQQLQLQALQLPDLAESQLAGGLSMPADEASLALGQPRFWELL